MRPSAVQVFFLQGDSGGPYVCKDSRGVFTLRGVASYVAGRSHEEPCTGVTVYVNVAYYQTWITDVMTRFSESERILTEN